MSTNYYAFGPFPGGEAETEGLHIGQAAAGWRFLFRAHPEQGITSLTDWRALLLQQATRITNEYGVEYTPDEMIEIGTQRATDDERWPLKRRIPRPFEAPDGYHVDAEGFEFCAHEFF